MCFVKGVLQGLHLFETPPGAECDAAERLIRDENRQTRRLAQHVVEVAKQRAPARQHDTLVHDVRRKLRRRVLQPCLDRVDDGAHRLRQALGYLPPGKDDLLGHAVHQVVPLDVHALALAVLGRRGRTHLFLDPLRAPLARQQVMSAAHVGDNALVHLVAAHAYGARIDDATQREHRDIGGAPADVDHHRAGRLHHGKFGPDGGCHRLLDHEDAPRAGALGRLPDRTAFHGRGAGRHADDDLRAREAAPLAHLADEVLDHLLRHLEVGNDAVSKRTDRLDVSRCAADHPLGLVADGEHLLPALAVDEGYLEMSGPVTLALNVVMMGLAFALAWLFATGPRQRVAISLECGVQNGTLAITVGSLLLEDTAVVVPAATYSILSLGTALIFVGLVRGGAIKVEP